MKRLFTLLAIVALLPAISFAQVNKAEAPQRQGYNNGNGNDNIYEVVHHPLYGDVESITIKQYEFEKKSSKAVKGKMWDWEKCTFNQRGDLIEQAHYLSNGNLRSKILYKYDSVGNMIEKADYYSDGSLDWKYLYKYDSAGNMIEETYDSNDRMPSTYLYKYDSAGNRIEEAYYKSDGSLDRKKHYKYDSAGNIIEKAYYNSDGSWDCGFLYKYDSAGNMIEGAAYYSDRSLDSKDLLKYDSAGNIIVKTHYKGEIMVPQNITEYEIVYRN